jgi:glycosyltransferase involved in cell wall biosynthesis
MKILVEGWFNIPHSYAIVNNFQLVHLLKNYPNTELYIKEREYFKKEWNDKKKLIYTEEYNNTINKFKFWSGEEIDVVYRITYPYDIHVTRQFSNTPICVYFTAEFKNIDKQYFDVAKLGGNVTEEYIKEYIVSHPNLYFTSPSEWSANSLEKYGLPKGNKRHQVITGGVDTTIFFHDKRNRRSIRDFYGLRENDIVFLNIGAMTRNKGILEILVTINALVNKAKMRNVKLLLKGTTDLYESQQFVVGYFQELQNAGYINKEEVKNLVDNHIVFIQQTLGYNRMNDIYNACDIYISPYTAEGFNLPVLEAIATGMKVLASKGGSTEFFINDIINAVPDAKHYIYKIPSSLRDITDDKQMLQIDCNDLVKLCLGVVVPMSDNASYHVSLKQFIDKNYSWSAVSVKLHNYLESIISNS